jgi:alpha-tubulin suppressor-like RCC1 family protein
MGLQEYAKRMIDMGCDELLTIFDRTEITSLADALEMSRMEKDSLEEGFKLLKKAKKPKSLKEKKTVEKPKVAAVLFDFHPPPAGATTRLFTWGDSTNGQLGLVQARTGANCHTPTWVDALKNKNEPSFAACGAASMAAITRDGGNLYTWGTGPIGLGADKMESSRPFLVTSLRDVPMKMVACGGSHMIALSRDGDVFAWGAGDSGQLGLGDKVQGAASPILVAGVGPKDKAPIVQCSAGAEHTLLVSTHGDLYAFGEPSKGRLGLPSTDKVFLPTRVKALDGHPVGQSACGEDFSICIAKTGAAAYWFGNVCGTPRLSPEKVPRFTNRPISQCCAGGDSGMFLVGLSIDTNTGEFGMDASVYTFGKDPYLLGQGDEEPRSVPTLLEDLEGHGVKQISMSSSHAGCLTADGRVLMWGRDDCGQLGSSYMVSIKRPAETIKISGFKYTFLACGEEFTSAIGVEDKESLMKGIDLGNPCPPPPPPDEAVQQVEAEGEDLQKLLDAFAVMSHKFDLDNEEPPPPPDDDDDLDSLVPPPPMPPAQPKVQTTTLGGKRILPPGSEEIGEGCNLSSIKNRQQLITTHINHSFGVFLQSHSSQPFAYFNSAF